MTKPTPLTPVVQAIVNAAIKDDYGKPTPILYRRLAATLRTAADYLDHPTSAHTLYAIADELETH